MGIHTKNGVPNKRVLPGIVPFQANATSNFPMQTNSVIESVTLMLSGILTLAGFTTAPTMRKDAVEQLVRGVRFTGNTTQAGQRAVQFSNVDFTNLRLMTAVFNNTFPDKSDIGTANGAYAFASTVEYPFSAKRTNMPGGSDITDLDTRKLQSFALNIDWNDVNAMIVAGSGIGGTAVLSNVQITVTVKERFVSGAQNGAPFVKRTQRTIDLSQVGAGVNRVIPNIPRGNFLLRQWMIFRNGDGPFADRTDAIVVTTQKPEGAHVQTIVTGQRGDVSRFDVAYLQEMSDNRKHFKLEQWPVGTVVLEYSPMGIPKDFLDLRTTPPTSILDAKNLLDLTLPGGTNTLTIVDEEFIPNV